MWVNIGFKKGLSHEGALLRLHLTLYTKHAFAHFRRNGTKSRTSDVYIARKTLSESVFFLLYIHLKSGSSTNVFKWFCV